MNAPKMENCPLFAGIAERQLKSLLDCLSATRQTYARDKFVFRADSKSETVGIVLTGRVYIIQEDFWGNRMILSHIEPGGLFGEAVSCAEIDRLPFSAVTSEKSEIMLIDYRKIVTTCSSACIFHTSLIKNMLHILAEKNIALTKKMEHLSKRTTRGKLLSFLSAQAVQEKNNVVETPFNRQELADYLCVDRSALSRELSLMQKEGLLRYDKNRFELLRDVHLE